MRKEMLMYLAAVLACEQGVRAWEIVSERFWSLMSVFQAHKGQGQGDNDEDAVAGHILDFHSNIVFEIVHFEEDE